MIRLRDIFKGKARGQEEILPVDAVDVPDPAADEALFLLIEELADLGEVRVPAAARERGWAQVRADVHTQQARGAFAPAGARLRGMVYTRRLAIGSTVALVAIALGLVGVRQLDGRGSGPSVVDNAITTAAIAVAGNSSITQKPSSTTSATPATTKPITPGDTASSPSSTSGSSVTSPGTGTSGATAPSPSTTATEPGTNTTEPGTNTTEPGTSTTQPASTTTSEQLMTAEERERSATAAAAILAEAVVSGDTDEASSVLSSSAKRGLVQMVATLHDAQSSKIISVETAAPQVSNVLVQFTDDTADVQGQPPTVVKRFLFELRVDQSGALVIGIYAAPAQ